MAIFLRIICKQERHRASFSNAKAEFVVAGDVKRSAGGGSVTTS